MAEMKKYLDQQGVAHLWSKLSMEDYPNNETLMAVINAIDETKADKSDINASISLFYINITKINDTYTSDKTIAEIVEANENNK